MRTVVADGFVSAILSRHGLVSASPPRGAVLRATRRLTPPAMHRHFHVQVASRIQLAASRSPLSRDSARVALPRARTGADGTARVVERIVARQSRRDQRSSVGTSGDGHHTTVALRSATAAAPVRRVLHRPPAAVAPESPRATEGEVRRPVVPRGDGRLQLAPNEVEHVADKVMQTIDRRLTAYRERRTQR